MIKLVGKVEDAYVQHCNGPGTAKELVVSATVEHEDEDGSFPYPDQFTIPVPFNTPLGDMHDIKTITIIIE